MARDSSSQSGTSHRGFASMDADEVSEIASMGGSANTAAQHEARLRNIEKAQEARRHQD